MKLRLDNTVLNELYGGDKGDYADMISLFLEKCPAHLVQLSVAVSGSAFGKISELSHKLKPMYKMVGLEPLAELASVMEDHTKLKNIERISEMFDELSRLHSEGCLLLSDELTRLQKRV